MTDRSSNQYLEMREKEERDAAAAADTEVARDIHLRLAEEYAARTRKRRTLLGITKG